MIPTIRDVARKASVSIATVSMALKGDMRVAQATREKVEKIARLLHYVPSNLGRALQSNKSRLIGYILSDVTHSFFSEIVQGIGEEATAKGYGLLVGITDGSREKEAQILRLFREKSIDGLLVSAWHPESVRHLLDCDRGGVPVVVCSGESFNARIPYVVIDNVAGGRIAAEHLIRLGHRRLSYAFADAGCLRYLGCLAAARRKKITRPALCATEKELSRLLRSAKRPTGVVAFSDVDAIRVKHLAEEAGLRIPRDLSVTGFDDIQMAALPEFNLTTIAQPQREIGRLSMEMLWRRMKGEKVKSRVLPPALIVRNSTAAPLSKSTVSRFARFRVIRGRTTTHDVCFARESREIARKGEGQVSSTTLATKKTGEV